MTLAKNVTSCGQPVKYQDDKGTIVVGQILSFGGPTAAIPVMGALTFSPDNTLDLGSPDGGVTLLRPRTIYVGASVQSPIFQSTTANAAASGVVRLGAADLIAWRNVTNTGDVTLTLDSGNHVVASTGFYAGAFGTTTSGPATAGQVRLAKSDSVQFRNNANLGNVVALSLTVNDQPQVVSLFINSDGAAGVTSGLCFVAQTSQAGAGAGTLTNAPAAGNPTLWLPINVNGVLKAVPCW